MGIDNKTNKRIAWKYIKQKLDAGEIPENEANFAFNVLKNGGSSKVHKRRTEIIKRILNEYNKTDFNDFEDTNDYLQK
jgi:hypothetical protein